MSSMLKKTGGLAFKPKARGRRDAPAPSASSQTPTAPTPSSATRAPTTELQTTPAEVSTLTPPSTNSANQDFPTTQSEKQKEKEREKAAARPPSPDLTQATDPTAISRTDAPPASKTTGRRRQSAAASAPKPVVVNKEATTTSTIPVATAITSERSVPTPSSSRRTRNDADTVDSATSASAGPTADSDEPSASSTPVDTQTETASKEPSSQPKKKRSYTRRKPQSTDEGGSETTGDGSRGAAPRRRASTTSRKRTTKSTVNSAGEATPGADGEAGTGTRPSKRRRRSPTPEDAMNIKVDHTAVKMGELTRDLGIGVPFKHAEAIAERAREARNRARLRKLEKDKIRMGLLPDPGDDVHGTKRRESEAPKSRMGSSAPDNGDAQGPDTAGPGYIVVDGQIIINQQSLMIDQHASENDISRMRTVEEDDFTHLTTSASFMRESRVMGANSWTEDETEKFYNYLSMFGTDFETISHMFPGKNRRMIKLKFNREERLRPNRINAAVMVRAGKDVNIDLDHYKEKRANWQEADEIMQEHQALVEDHNVEIQRLKAERRAQGLADDDDDADAILRTTKPDDGPAEGGEGGKENGADGGEGQETEQDEAQETQGDDAALGTQTLVANEIAAAG